MQDSRVRPNAGSNEVPILVVGAPRSGTTWVGRAIATGYGAQLVNEPDSENLDPFALKAKLGLGRFPVLAADDEAPPTYIDLWDRAFRGIRTSRGLRTTIARRLIHHARTNGELARAQCWRLDPGLPLKAAALLARSPSIPSASRRVVVKSVHSPLAVEWVDARMSPRIVIVTRHPLNVVASWLDLGYRSCHLAGNAGLYTTFGALWDIRPPSVSASELTHVTWEVGLLISALRIGLARHAGWVETSHEALCFEPRAGFEHLFARLGLRLTETVERFVERSNRPGRDPYGGHRVSRDQPSRWRRTLSDEQRGEIADVLSGFPLLGIDPTKAPDAFEAR